MEDIVIASFQDQCGFREGMTELRRAHENGALRVRAAAVLERRDDGTWSSDKVGASAGDVVETLLGALTGPVAEHLGSTPGMGADDVLDDTGDGAQDLILEVMVRHVPPGTTAIVADIEEESSDDSLDLAISDLGGLVKRWPRAEVSAELDRVDEAADADPGDIRQALQQDQTPETRPD